MAASILRNGFKSHMSIKSNFVLAIAAFWVNFCLLGVLRSNSVIYRGLVDVFGVKRKDAAWPSGIFGFFMCVTGALSGFLSHYISIRTLAVFGAILASTSVSICCLVSNMLYINIFYGALQGAGVGIIVPLTHVVLNQNFSKYKAVALGIAYSGTSAGSFMFPPIANLLFSHYGLKGTFLILGGIMLNSLMGAMMFKSPGKPKVKEKDSSSELHNPAHENCTEVAIVSKENDSHSAKAVIKIVDQEAGSTECEAKKIVEEKTAQIEPKTMITPEFPIEETSQLFKIDEKSQQVSILRLSFEILSSPAFIIVSIAYACYFTISAVFLMVAVDFARDRSMTAEAGVFLVSTFSIGDLIGRLGSGWLADLQWIPRTTIVRGYLFAMGVFVAILPICSEGFLSAAVVFLGLLNGGILINKSVLLNEYLGLQKLPLAIGYSTCLVGMTAFLRPVIIGFFRDRNQNYNQLFYFLGLLQICITAVWSLEVVAPIYRRYFFVNKLSK